MCGCACAYVCICAFTCLTVYACVFNSVSITVVYVRIYLNYGLMRLLRNVLMCAYMNLHVPD